MPPKEKTKRTLTPDQLEKLAVARARANEVRIAMKEGRQDAQVAALQAKMDVLKAKKKPPTKEEPTVPEEPEPEPLKSTPTPDEESAPDKEDKVAKPAPAVEPKVEPVSEPQCKTEAGISVEKLKKKTQKKKIIVMPNSDSSDSEDDSNVIFVKKTSRKKKETPQPAPPPPTPQLPQAQYHRPPSNPFFNPMFSYGSRNFQ